MSSPGFPFDSSDATPPADADRPHITTRLPPVGGVVYDPAFLKLYDLPTSPQVLLDDTDLTGRASWGNDLTMYTGTGYLSGAAVGVFAGLRRAIVETEHGESAKLRVNRILNNCGTLGRSYGNRVGLIAMLFVGTNTGVRMYRSGADDWINTAAAGIGTGALFRMPGGLRAAMVGGVVGGLVAGAAIVAGKAPMINRSTPNTSYRSY